MWVPPARDPASFSVWFERSVAAVKLGLRRVGWLLVAVWLLLGVAAWLLVVSMFDSGRGRELRRLLEIDQTSFGPTGSSVTAELTDLEAERAWELAQDIFWAALPWLVVLGVAFVVVAAWSVALVARAVQPHVADSPIVVDSPIVGDSAIVAIAPDERLAAMVGAAIRRVPVVIASGIMVCLLFAGVWVVVWLPVVLVAVAGAGGAAIVLTVLFVVLLLLVVMTWLWVRLSLASVIAAAGGHGIGVKRSWDLTHGRFWYVAARLLITGLIAGVASGVVNSLTGFGQFLGFSVYFAIAFVLQSVAIAAAVVITVSGHLVTIDQIDDVPTPTP